MAILNPAHITPFHEIDAEARVLAEDLVFDRAAGCIGPLHPVLRGPNRGDGRPPRTPGSP